MGRGVGAFPGRGHVPRLRISMATPRRTVLISGCSSGLGLELAVQLARDPKQRYQGKGPPPQNGRDPGPAPSAVPSPPAAPQGRGEPGALRKRPGLSPSASPLTPHWVQTVSSRCWGPPWEEKAEKSQGWGAARWYIAWLGGKQKSLSQPWDPALGGRGRRVTSSSRPAWGRGHF